MPELSSEHNAELVVWQCPACRRIARVPLTTPAVHCCCGYHQLNGVSMGLGDMLAAGLHVAGITPEQYVRWKQWILGGERSCNCHKRQAKLNALGRKLGIGKV